uniref:Uncharacterized protein n=1 Tax=Panagrellus redivivus TaxID=6233 RepID=A0A7E4UYF5_PANRE
MSDSQDVKPIFASIRVKKEPVDHSYDFKPVKVDFETSEAKRPGVKRKVTKRKKGRRKKKRKVRRRGKTTSTRGPVHKALMRQLGIDLDDKKPKDEFNPVIPEDPSLPDSDEKLSPTLDVKPNNDTEVPAPPSEDLLDSILGQQEAMFSQGFKSKRKTLTPEELREKEERRRKRQEIKDEQRRKEEEVRRKQREIRDMERREKERKEMEESLGSSNGLPKRKSRFSDESPFVNAFEQKHKLHIQSMHPIAPITDQFHQLQIPMSTAANFNPLALLQQQNSIEQSLQQNALLQQQIQFEYLAAASLQNSVNPLVAQMIQNAMPQPSLLFANQPNNGLLGLAPPPPPPPDMFPLGNPLSSNSFLSSQLPPVHNPFDLGCSSSSFLNDPPPPPALPDSTDRSITPEPTGKKAHVSAVASVVKPLADKYGKRYKLSTADYKKMCVKIVKKVAKYNTPPKPERIELLVEEYARYLHRKSEHQRKKR